MVMRMARDCCHLRSRIYELPLVNLLPIVCLGGWGMVIGKAGLAILKAECIERPANVELVGCSIFRMCCLGRSNEKIAKKMLAQLIVWKCRPY